jgi:predicted adenine nucleotide alpha hydrolase (AANH) superfamily ATPase
MNLIAYFDKEWIVMLYDNKPVYGGENIGSQSYESKGPFAMRSEKDRRRSVLLHSCCGPCSTACIERLIKDYDVTVFFYNPCITDQSEYDLRKENQIKFIEAYRSDNPWAKKHLTYIEGTYDPARYLDLVRGLEEEPEGGKRCRVCFRMRLEETAKKAQEQEFDAFSTTLSVSPHKDFDIISRIGREEGLKYSIEFLSIDFKKKAGFERSVQLSKQYRLYRQRYCGCEFSKR